MDKKFCIFDLDGTLADSMGYWRQLEYNYLTERGVKPGPKMDELIQRLKPMTLADAGRAFIEELGLSGTPESIAEEMNEVMRGHYRFRIPLKNGVKDYLTALRARGTTLCVASATDSPLVRTCLQRLGADGFFEFIVSCVDVGASKVRPDVYLEAARRLGAKPEDSAVFEDAVTALRTAKKAGFYTVAVYDEYSSEDWESMQTLADEAVASWPQALERFQSI